ncbi:MAG TPA: hypothetical protein VK427_06225 [Kofleriaceae bacterium]|nr:hypothetical protein [Kofleriaceae bacterium]
MALLIALLLGGCVIPPSLSVDNQDAGVNSPPSILAVRSDQASYSEPGPMTLVRRESMLNVQLLDTDVNDTLYVRVFVEYTVDDPKAARAFCRATPIQATRRSVTCDVGAVCTEADVASTVTKPLDMTIVVFDREPLETGEPAFQAMPEGGLSTSRFFFLNCVDAR